MIFIWLTHDEALLLRTTCIYPQVRARLDQAIQDDILPDDGLPRTVLLHDDGSGLLPPIAVEYYDQQAADRAFEIAYRKLQGEPEPEGKPKKKRRKKVA